MMTALERTLAGHAPIAVAVSGGVDSMVLAHLAHRSLGAAVRMVHAISPAVPARATERVRIHARANGWQLDLVDAGEFHDPRYRANPLNRCYFCKLNLYETIADLTDAKVASGTNRNDLGDFRPGLAAAREHSVVHPYVDAGIGKRQIYALARALGLDDLAELPAQPCLASRVETGIGIDRADLAFIDRIEARLHDILGVGATVRCRITRGGVVIELEDENAAARIRRDVASLCRDQFRTFLGFRPYRQGAAFLRDGAA